MQLQNERKLLGWEQQTPKSGTKASGDCLPVEDRHIAQFRGHEQLRQTREVYMVDVDTLKNSVQEPIVRASRELIICSLLLQFFMDI